MTSANPLAILVSLAQATASYLSRAVTLPLVKTLATLWVVWLSSLVLFGLYMQYLPPPTPSAEQLDMERRDGASFANAADGRVIEYFVAGPTEGRILINIAGNGFTGKLLAKCLPSAFLEKNNIRLISISLPGFGFSTPLRTLTYKDWIHTDLAVILTTEKVLKSAPLSVMGHSAGAAAALCVASAHAPRVLALGLRSPYIGAPFNETWKLPPARTDGPATVGPFAWSSHLFVRVATKLSTWLAKPTNVKLVLEHSNLFSRVETDLYRARAHSYLPFLYAAQKSTSLDNHADPATVKTKKVVVWYADDEEDDEGTPIEHFKWFVWHFKAKVRIVNGFGAMGPAVLEQEQFIEHLMDL